MTNLKYEILLEDFIIVNGNKKIYQIRSLVDFGDVKKGDLGGYIESEKNLSVSDSAWVYDSARVCGDAWVCGDARVYDSARVSENHFVTYGHVTVDISLKENIVDSITAQTNLAVMDGLVYAQKHVNKDLSSLYDSTFIYPEKGLVQIDDYEDSKKSCAKGLHVSNRTYWDNNHGKVVLFVTVKLEDIITVQEGKIRCKALTVLGRCEGSAH